MSQSGAFRAKRSWANQQVSSLCGLKSFGIDYKEEARQMMEEQNLQKQMGKLQLMTGTRMREDSSGRRILPSLGPQGPQGVQCSPVLKKSSGTYVNAAMIRR